MNETARRASYARIEIHADRVSEERISRAAQGTFVLAAATREADRVLGPGLTRPYVAYMGALVADAVVLARRFEDRLTEWRRLERAVVRCGQARPLVLRSEPGDCPQHRGKLDCLIA